MSTQASSTENGIGRKQLIERADPKAIKRAEWEAFEFEMEAPGIVRVINGSHENPEDHSYLVNVENGLSVVCECKADQYQDGPCKHRLAVTLREPVIEAANRHMMADGGHVSEVKPQDSNKDEASDSRERALKANSLACDLTDIEGAGEDFDAFCTVVKVTQDGILREWTSQGRQTERTNVLARTPEEVVQ